MKSRFLQGLCALVLLFSAQVAQGDALTDQARRLLEAGKPQEAYRVLQPLEPQRAGDADFDYLLGIAALDAGDAERAVFALERALAVRPGFSQARAEIARAYAALGERKAARQELETVKSTATDLAPEARATIDRFLGALSKPPTRVAGYMEAMFGIDSNVNSAVGSGSLAIPSIGIVTLAPAASRLSDSYWGLSGGISIAHPINEELAVTGGLRGGFRLNNGDSVKEQFDTHSADVDAGLRWTRGRDTFSGGFQGQTFAVDNKRLRNSAGLIAQWQRNLSDTQQFTLFGQSSDLTYPGQSVRNADRTIVGVGYAQALQGRYSPVVFVSGYMGSERERALGVPHLGHEPFGARIGMQLTLREDLTLNAFAAYEERRYNGQEPLFGVARRDRQTDLRVGLSWKLAPEWTLNPQLSYTGNSSNVNLFKYDRTVASVALRKDF